MPTSAARTCSTVATLEPRKNLADPRRGAPAARRRAAARGRGRLRLGRPAGAARSRTSCGSASSPTTSWRGSTAARPSPSTRRASRASGCRSSRRWRAARRWSPRRTSRWTRPRGAAAVRADPDDPAAIAAAIREALARRDELVPAGLEHARRFTWRAAGRVVPRRLRGGGRVIRAASTSRRSCRRAPGRRGTFAACSARWRAGTGSRWRRSRSAARAGRPRSRATRGGTTPACRARARGLDVLHCTTFRGPLRSSVPFTVTLHDLALVRHPELFPRWHRLSGRAGIGPVARAADRVLAVSEFTKREAVELLGVPRSASS